MNSIQLAVEQVKLNAKGARALILVADELEKLGSIEAAVQEAQAKKAALSVDVEALVAKQADLVGQIENQQVALEQLKASHVVMEKQAVAKASGMLDIAKTEAVALVDMAKSKVAGLNLEFKAKGRELADLLVQIQIEQDNLKTVQAQVKEVKDAAIKALG